VKKCTSRSDGAKYAVKIVNKRKLNEEETEALYDEINILKSLDHPHVLRLFFSYEEKYTVYLVTELISGGELFERIVYKGNYTEKETRDACKNMFEAIGHCHEHKVAHRDLKPENLLLTSIDNDSELKIADFGFAKHAEGDSLKTMCGTPSYVAPEIVRRRPYGVQVDMWSLGCIIYTLLCGYLPFYDEDMKRLFKKIYFCKYDFDGPYWDQCSEDAKDLVRKLLEKDTKKRFSAKDTLNHKWLKADDHSLQSRKLDATLKNLSNFNARRKFRAGVAAIITANKLMIKIDSKNTINSLDSDKSENE